MSWSASSSSRSQAKAWARPSSMARPGLSALPNFCLAWQFNNRANAPAEELDLTPDYEVDRLDAIPEKLGL